MINLKNISKIYPNGFVALDDVSLSVAKGEICGIIGYSGAGKSTLLRTINLLERPNSGKVIVNDKDMLALDEKALAKARQDIGMIFQHFNLLSAKNVSQNVAFALQIAGWDERKIAPRVAELLELVGLSQKANARISQLSGGQKQRVAIARALANSPKVLLCDEATSALDTKTTASILSLLKKLQQELNLSVVLITHQMEVVKAIADSVYVIDSGRIAEGGKASEVFSAPRTQIARELLGLKGESIEYGPQCYRIVFTGTKANEPLLSYVLRNFNIDANILSGNIDALPGGEVGHLNVKFIGQDSSIKSAISWLQMQGVSISALAKGAQKEQE